MRSAAAATRFFTSLNEQIFQKEIEIALEFHCIKKKCLSDTILICVRTLSHPTMSINTRISFRITSMCFRFVMTKAALAIIW